MTNELRLHIGGIQPKPGWKILDIEARPEVDFVGSCTDLSQFADGSVTQIYTSHVLEHLSYADELAAALKEIHRVLIPGEALWISVPDLEILSRLLLTPTLTGDQRYQVMRAIFGGQADQFDFHKSGWTFEFAMHYLAKAKFHTVQRVESFDLFEDANQIAIAGQRISLNLIATKAPLTPPAPPASSAPRTPARP